MHSGEPPAGPAAGRRGRPFPLAAALALAAALVAVSMASCGQGAPPPPTPIALEPPARGGVLTIAARAVVDTTDVRMEPSPTLASLGPGIVYSRLFRFRAGPGVEQPSMEVECDLCQSWEMDGPTTLRVRLRDGVRWQETPPAGGRLLSPRDVAASLERQRTGPWPSARLLGSVASVEAGRGSVVIRLETPDPDILLYLADARSKILPEELAALDSLDGVPVAGTGPWALDVYIPESRFEFIPWEGYFEEGLPYLERLRVLVVPDEATRHAALLTRLLDVDQVPRERWPDVSARYPELGWQGYRPPGSGVELVLNTRAVPLQDAQVRKALFMAVDPWALNQGVWGGLAYVATGLPAPTPRWLLPEAELREYLARPERALELLRTAGAGSPRLELAVADYGDPFLEYGERLAGQLRSSGFQVDVRALDPQAYLEQVWQGGRFTAYLGPAPPAASPGSYLEGVVHSAAPWNRTGYADPELDRMVEAQARELDPERRRQMVVEVQRRLLGEGVRFMPAAAVEVWAFWPRVRGLHVNLAGYEYTFWSRVWVEG